jgi:hypothetical protein
MQQLVTLQYHVDARFRANTMNRDERKAQVYQGGRKATCHRPLTPTLA